MSPRLDVPIRRPAVNRVARVAYAALAAVDATLAGLGGRAQEARVVTKTALMPTLALTAPPQPGLLTGLGLSWVGDVALLGRAPARVAAGAGTFAAAHVAYLAGMGTARRLHRNGRPPPASSGWRPSPSPRGRSAARPANPRRSARSSAATPSSSPHSSPAAA